MQRIILAAAFLALLGSVSWSADIQKGLAAHESGDYATAVREWTPLAEQGNAKAQVLLGEAYAMGESVPKDFKIAVKWYRLAAEQGNVRAQGNLGGMYFGGSGIIQDIVYAHMWMNISAANGNAYGVMLRDEFAKKMTPSQLAKAQKLARECFRKKYKGC